MNSTQKVLQYLNEAHATEQALTRTLQAHIAMTPRGGYRTDLERHLRETRSHAKSLQQRLAELGESWSMVGMGVGVLQSLLGQAFALGKGPFDLLRGASGEEKLLKNVKDESATEALEIATYRALEHFARRVGDEKTARLAGSIREDEERMLAVLQERIAALVDDVVRLELKDEAVYDVSKTGAAEAARRAGEKAEKTTKVAAKKTGSQARHTARRARKVPGVARAEGELKGAVASEQDLAIADYDSLNVDEVVGRLSELSQIDLAKVDAYERRHENRSTVLSRIDSLRSDEPWPGYDEQTVEKIRGALSRGDAKQSREVREYERRHKARQGVLQTAERALAGNSNAERAVEERSAVPLGTRHEKGVT
jgi:ferritin-like metal-binding protein YciE